MVRKFTRHENAPPKYQGLGYRVKAEHVNELQIALEDDDARISQKADTSAVHGIVVDEVANSSTVTDAAAAAVTAEISERDLVEGHPSFEDDVNHGFVGENDRASWLSGTKEGLPSRHSREIMAKSIRPLMLGVASEDISENSGWVYAIVDEDDRLAFGIRKDGSVWPSGGGEYPAPTPIPPQRETMLGAGDGLLVRDPDGSLRRYTSTRDVSFWGDSLIQGHPVPPFAPDRSDSLPGAFATLHSSGAVTNFGYTGKTADEIAIRQGGLVIELMPSGGAIPASGAVTVTTSQEVGWRPGSAWSSDGTLAGVAGTLTWNGSALSFARTSTGDSVPVPSPMPFMSTVGVDRFADITVILAGRNDVTYLASDPRVADRVVAAAMAMVDSLSPRYPRFILLGTLTGTNEPNGSAGHAIVTSINKQLAKLYPHNFLDLRRWLIDEAMDVMGLTPDSSDTANINADTLPPSLMNDTRHFTPATAAAIAQWLYTNIYERGWV